MFTESLKTDSRDIILYLVRYSKTPVMTWGNKHYYNLIYYYSALKWQQNKYTRLDNLVGVILYKWSCCLLSEQENCHKWIWKLAGEKQME